MRLHTFKSDIHIQAKLEAHRQRQAAQGNAMQSLASKVINRRSLPQYMMIGQGK